MRDTLRLWAARAARDDRGFTLVEMLVVITLVGVLTALIFPTMHAIQHSARITAVKASARDAYTAWLGQNAPTASNIFLGSTTGKIEVTTYPVGQDEVCIEARWTAIHEDDAVPNAYEGACQGIAP